jgi:DNA helicase HerA-like ATPase
VEPRVCLVLEEAHSLVPERFSYAATGEGEATAGTARALLQGRKYGLGTLLFTQRTANVTKTFLNQCHTVFAMRSFDARSEEFLENYIGREFASVLSTLDERQAVLFGRGSTSESPVLIDLNNRERFRNEIWPTLGPIPTTDLDPPAVPAPAAGPVVAEEPDLDELPF